MALKTAVLLVLLAILGIFEVHAASVFSEEDMWNDLDSDSDGDKRTADEDSVESEFYTEDEKDIIARDGITSDAAAAAAATDYYNNALENRAAPCRDAFASLCRRVKLRRNGCYKFAMARKFCQGSCPQLC